MISVPRVIYWMNIEFVKQGELRQEVLEHVSVEGHRALAFFRKKHPGVPGMTLKVISDIYLSQQDPTFDSLVY